MRPDGPATIATFEVRREEQRMAVLRAGWADVDSARQTAKRRRRKEVVSEWETRVHELKADQRAIAAAGHWVRGPSDLLSVIGRERRETYHSKVLAWLMDPLAPHGLGSTFLGAFLVACDPSWELHGTLHDVHIRCEEARPSCRADIVVWTDEFTLVVENKIDAAEGTDQCDRIYADFKDEPDPRFVFLSPSGRLPLTATGEARAHFRTVSYRTLTRDLAALLIPEPSGTAPGRAAAEGYFHTLQEMF